MVVYDIGANVGFYTLLASKLAGDTGRVYSFEPFPGNIEYLKKHVAINKLSNVEIIDKAVSDQVNNSLFKIGKNNSVGRLNPDGDIVVETITLEEFILDGNLPPSVIKMDIEGAEFNALLGAEKLLKEHSPKIFLATHGDEVKENCLSLLDRLKYKFYPISSDSIEECDEILAEKV